MKTVTKIRQEDGTVTEDIVKILEVQVNFYEKLYKETKTCPEAQKLFLSSLDRALPAQERESCEGLITVDEVKKEL